MKPDCWVCPFTADHTTFKEPKGPYHGIGKEPCPGTLTPMYSRDGLINWLQERKKKTWRYYNDPESKVIPNESMYATLGAFDAVIAELTAGEDNRD